MNKIKIFFFFGFLLLSCILQAQNKNIFDLMGEDRGGNVNIYQDAEIKQLTLRYRILPPSVVNGFRVQIYFGGRQNAKQEVSNVQNSFMSKFPEYRTYISYTAPYYKLTAGNFLSHDEASAAFEKIRQYFNTSTIVRETVNVKDAKQQNDEEDDN